MTQRGINHVERAAGSRGFTFVELVLAVGILAIVAVGTAAAMVQGPRLTRVAREEMIVRSAMRGMVAEISSAPYSEVAAAFSGEGFEVPGLASSAVDEDKLPGLIRIDEVREGTARYYRATLIVTWQGVQGTRSVQSIHYISNVRGDTATELPAGTPLEGLETLSTDPNISYYEERPVTVVAQEEDPYVEDPLLAYVAQQEDSEVILEASVPETAIVPLVEPVTDPVETVATSVNGG